MIQQKIDTFKGLGSPGLDRPVNHRLTLARADYTLQFMKEWGLNPDSILDIAGPSIVGEYMSEKLNCKYRVTYGDLDHVWWPVKTNTVDTVIMLEVLEHILNPLKFLEELKDSVAFNNIIISWPCRPSPLWTYVHFHEMRLDRFRYLCKLAGYKIVQVKKVHYPETWYNKFYGIRPFLRYFFNYNYVVLIRPL